MEKYNLVVDELQPHWTRCWITVEAENFKEAVEEASIFNGEINDSELFYDPSKEIEVYDENLNLLYSSKNDIYNT